MTKRTTTKLAGYSALFLVTALAACTAGTGAPGEINLGYENKKGDFQSPANGQSKGDGESSNGGSNGQPTPTPTTTTAPTTTSTGGGGNCPPCDQKFTCQVTTSSGSQTRALELKTSEGKCTIAGGVIIGCDGTVSVSGQAAGTWTRTGSTFTVTLGTDKYVCTPGSGPADAGAVPADGG